jgi:hypothetical protein
VVPNNDDDDWSRKVERCLGVDWDCGEVCGRVMWDGFGSGWVGGDEDKVGFERPNNV